MIGGKTGTAETLPRGNGEYVVSFMGYAPADDPQIAIYVVVDRPNVQYQDDAKHATRIVRKVLTEVLPYLNIFMTEELSDEERAELEELQIQIRTPQTEETGEEVDEEGNPIENPDGEDTTEEETDNPDEAGEEGTEANTEVWKSFPVDPETGYLVDPSTGDLIDPDMGTVISGGSMMGEETTEDTSEDASTETPVEDTTE